MCDFIVAGSILRGFQDQVLGPAGFHERCQSVKFTYDRLKSINIHTYPCTPGDGEPLPPACQTHEGRCDPTVGLHEELDDCFLQHLEQQSKITRFNRWMW